MDKIELIRNNIKTKQNKNSLSHIFKDNKSFSGTCEATDSLNNFNLINLFSLKPLFSIIKPKQSFTDPIPVWLLKECSGLLDPIIVNIVNKSLADGIFPATLKKATVIPIIKDKSKDKNDLKNYRPVSTLPFLSKVTENEVHQQVVAHLEKESLFPMFQSAYRSSHSCETALFKITYDMEKDMYDNNLVAFLSLDLSSAFDTIDHYKLLQLLEYKYNITGNALKWFKSYLGDRNFNVKIQDELSNEMDLKYGVPQGSVLGPMLFILYISDIYKVVNYHSLRMHFYADDTQLYIGIDPSHDISLTLNNISSCLNDLETWMNSHFLKLNVEKTNVLFIGKQSVLDKFPITFQLGSNSYISNSGSKVKLLGTTINQNLTYKDTMRSCVKSCYFNLHKLKSIRHYLDENTKIKLVHAFILSRLNYCNILYANTTNSDLNYMQKVINASVRFIYNLSRRTHTRHFIKQCHFLSMNHRIMFKCNVMVYRILKMKDKCPTYLQEIFVTKDYVRNTRGSSDIFILEHGDPQGNKFNNNSIAGKMVKHWNDLSPELRHLENFEQFRNNLKTHYFKKWLDSKGI